jgi:hypothetical protein
LSMACGPRRHLVHLAVENARRKPYSTLMDDSALVIPLEYPALRGVETLSVGSAKVPRLPCLRELVEAPDVETVAAVLAAHSGMLDGYAAALAADGLGDMAATLRRVLERAARLTRMNADLAAVLTWLLNAQHKTAGRATMTFAPWAAAAGVRAPACVDTEDSGATRVALSQPAVAATAVANAWVYERLIGRLNASACGRPGGAVADIPARIWSGSALRPRFAYPHEVKSLLKIDYKLDREGDLVIVDVNAGLVGAWFDDLLLDRSPESAAVPERITPRLVEAVLGRYRLQRGSLPRRVALCVLDEEMFRQWETADIAGLTAELRRQIEEAGAPAADIAVIDAAGLVTIARRQGAPALFAGAWEGTPELIVFYSCRIAPDADPAVLAALDEAGVTLVDSAVHGVAASKELTTPDALGSGLPKGVRLPETFILGAADDGAGAVAAVEQAWAAAAGRGWGLLAVKIDKQRREGAAGDFPTAFLYPVTALGRELAERQIERTFDGVTAASGQGSRLVVTHVDHLGGCDGPLGRRDIEIRTYAFPVLPL